MAELSVVLEWIQVCSGNGPQLRDRGLRDGLSVPKSLCHSFARLERKRRDAKTLRRGGALCVLANIYTGGADLLRHSNDAADHRTLRESLETSIPTYTTCLSFMYALPCLRARRTAHATVRAVTDGPARRTEKRTLRRKSAGSGLTSPSTARLRGVATLLRHLPASVGKRPHHSTFFRDKG